MDKIEKFDEIAKDIKAAIDATFTSIAEIYASNQELLMRKNPSENDDGKLVFPKYGNREETRISEQELRFEFIQQLLSLAPDYFYSVETPTQLKYRFSKPRTDFKEYGVDISVPRIQTQADLNYDEAHKGIVKRYHSICESAQFDTVLMNSEGNRVAYIEFKGMNAPEKEYRKDFLKLNAEGCEHPHLKSEKRGKRKPCFFIQLLKNEKQLKEEFLNSDISDLGLNDTTYVCYTLDGKQKYCRGDIDVFNKDSDYIKI